MDTSTLLNLFQRSPSHARPGPVATTRYERHEGFHVLRLAGDDYEMGYQHGVLLREAIARGPLHYFSDFVDRILVRSFGVMGKPVARAVGVGLGETVGRVIAARFPQFVRDGLAGLADGAGIPRPTLMRAVTMPETYLWVLSQYISRRGYPIAPRLAVPTFGCTSVLAWGEATKDGTLFHGRNFDYQGVGAWDTEPLVSFIRPADGQRYVSIAAAGILMGGITAMNASGLSLVVHQHLASLDFDLGGLPVGVVGDMIMRHARNLDDAKRLLDGHTPNGAWTYVIASAKENAVLIYEVTSRKRASFRPEGGTFGYSNMYVHKHLESREVFAYPAQWRHCAARFHRSNQLLKARHGSVDADAIASFLGDIGDPRCRFEEAISVLQTVASVVFQPGAGLVYAAKGRAPVPNRPFVAFDLNEERVRTDLPELAGGTRIPPRALAAFDHYRAGYEAYFNRDDMAGARRGVEEARREEPGQPVYAFVAGLLALSEGEAEVADWDFSVAIQMGHPAAERIASFHLWRARARDIAGRRDEALADYRGALGGDPAVHAAANRGLRAPWKHARVPIEWNFGDVVTP